MLLCEQPKLCHWHLLDGFSRSFTQKSRHKNFISCNCYTCAFLGTNPELQRKHCGKFPQYIYKLALVTPNVECHSLMRVHFSLLVLCEVFSLLSPVLINIFQCFLNLRSHQRMQFTDKSLPTF